MCYPDCEDLFVKCLKLKDATLEMAVNDIINVLGKSDMDLKIRIIKSLILCLSEFANRLKNGHVIHFIKELNHKSWLPVWKQGSLGMCLLARAEHFFIADRKILLNSFKDSVPFLDIAMNQIYHLQHLLELLQIDGKLLSNAVVETWSLEGIPVVEPALTNIFRSKSRLLFQLVLGGYQATLSFANVTLAVPNTTHLWNQKTQKPSSECCAK